MRNTCSYLLILLTAPCQLFAQSSLSLYGTVDAGFAYQSHSTNTSGSYVGANRFAMIYGGQSANRIGLKGNEQINSQLSVNFVLENGFNLGNGTFGQSGRLFGRTAWLGLNAKDLGTLRLGRQYSFANEYLSDLTPFGPSDFSNASLGLSFGSANADRLSNMIRFETDAIEGFKAGIGYSFAAQMPSAYLIEGSDAVRPGDTRDYNYATQNNLRSITSGIQYQNGPLYSTATYDSYYPNVATAGGEVPNAYAWILGVAYDWSLFRLSGAYGQTRNAWLNPTQSLETYVMPSNLGDTNSSILFDSNIAINSYLIGITLKPNELSKLYFSLQRAQPMASMQSTASFPLGTQNVYSVAYTYNFTPRTNIYAMGAYSTNYSMSQGLTNSIIGFGIRHKF